jgi:hypothetical protein
MNDIARVSFRLAQPIFADPLRGKPRHRRLHRHRRVVEQHRRAGMIV